MSRDKGVRLWIEKLIKSLSNSKLTIYFKSSRHLHVKTLALKTAKGLPSTGVFCINN